MIGADGVARVPKSYGAISLDSEGNVLVNGQTVRLTPQNARVSGQAPLNATNGRIGAPLKAVSAVTGEIVKELKAGEDILLTDTRGHFLRCTNAGKDVGYGVDGENYVTFDAAKDQNIFRWSVMERGGEAMLVNKNWTADERCLAIQNGTVKMLSAKTASNGIYLDSGVYTNNLEESFASIKDKAIQIKNEPLTQIKVKKVWAGNAATDSIQVKLYSDIEEAGLMKQVVVDEVSKTLILQAPEWSGEFTDLPRYTTDKDGTKRQIQYRVVEDPVPTGYVDSYDVTAPGPDSQDQTTWNIVINNSPIDSRGTSFTAEKKWEGIDEAEYSDYSITVKLLSDAAREGQFVEVGQEAILSSANNWKYTWYGLDKYAADGKRVIQYKFEEVLPAGFEATYSDVQTVATPNPEDMSGREFYAYSEENGISGQPIGHQRYFIDHHEPGSTTTQWVQVYNYQTGRYEWQKKQVYTPGARIKREIAYCLQYNKGNPPSTRSDERFNRYATSPSDLASKFSRYGANGTQPYYGTADGDKLYNVIRMIAFYGYGNDAAGLQEKHGLSDAQFNYLTQFAVWEYTDFYGSGYEDKINRSYGLTGSGYYYGTGVQIQGSKMRNAFKELMTLVDSDKPEDLAVIADVELYIYESIDKPNATQYLLGIETLNVEMNQSVTNKRVNYELLIYKYGVGEGEARTALKNAEFDLYLETQSGTEFTFGTTTFKGTKVNEAPLKTADDGYVKTGEVLTIGKTYYLVETKAPAGYFALAEPVKFTVRADGTSTVVNNTQISADSPAVYNHLALTSEEMGVHSGKYSSDADCIGVLEIENKETYELPSSGGIGTLWFTVFGTMLMALAAVYAINLTSRRRPVRANRAERRSDR